MSSVTANLTYFVPPADGSPAWSSTVGGKRVDNFTTLPRPMQIENLRGKEDTVSLDKTGFQLFKRPAKHTSFENEKEILEEYYPECEALLKELTGASKVVFFDHTIRRRRPGEPELHGEGRQPVNYVHVDQSTSASVSRVSQHFPPDEASERLRRRFQIINLWRPIGRAALDWPLALCDCATVDTKGDMLPITIKNPTNGRDGESFGVKWNENHKWGYFRGVGTDELVLIKCYDSIEDGSVSVFTPHTAFQDPTTPDGTPLRESIEMRALVFYD